MKPVRFDLMKVVWTNTILNMYEYEIPEDIVTLIVTYI